MKIQANFRVVAEPPSLLLRAVTMREAEQLRDEIKRHCDVESVSTECDMVCSFCGDIWENIIDENGMPICCNKAIEEYKKDKEKK